ncbi:Nif3-like dinuclear metal center hexameric protein [Exiguobacterium sp. SH3S2]|uniref:Nif3-like dinuclear metal center hexameric protein n=1 Tax=unclassified Exiguobacterium TaxID=2644629 RepID=UPI00103DB2C0|nr:MULTISPECIES: Nif3-like dinuclear metal center hexameric protein [unclassified Exiguobacterium]TCI46241.1 Nif3-like dinuclear metal center hexameric protein [Exiguobacterium sp. SH3S3]TCI56968.1 Nif3-like dinuclear metal center hexameric protein [Exiguobacterium sp. SH5S13]TCI59007.1 Nif3-like dinuclear metal center hexameric protein [Exiguobacterium sp. SH3S1]TCI61882.1 Nif3-like dinuclear metal center hexameric protein [Exiguobacterium sp. SH3S2]
MANGNHIIQLFEEFAPKHLAVEGDKIGLQIGTLNKQVNRVMVTLDVLESVVDEAIEQEVDLIIAHHPPIFSALTQVTDRNAAGRIVMKCLQNDIAVYVAHTNLDVCEGGVNDWMSEALGLHETEVLVPTYEEPVYKLSVFVPETHQSAVSKALGKAGAGRIGNYGDCQFTVTGKGQFTPLDLADPYLGQIGKTEQVDEVKIETIVTESKKKRVLKAMFDAHPYEEVAHDLIRDEIAGPVLGLGRIGRLDKPLTLAEFSEHVKASFGVEAVRVVGDLDRTIKKVAVLGGDGNKYVSAAHFKGADAYVTGDLYFHVAHDAMALGLAVVDPGHHVESVMKQGVVDVLQQKFTAAKLEVELLVSATNTNPFKFR